MKKLILILVLIPVSLFSQENRYGFGTLIRKNAARPYYNIADTTRQLQIGINYDPLNYNTGGNYGSYWHHAQTTGNDYWVFSHNSTGLGALVVVNDVDGTPTYIGLRNLSGSARLWSGASQNTDYLNIDGSNVTIDNHLIPAADGTQNLGVQTTAQWANVWSDLINGADYSYINGWRTLESEKYLGYPKGIAIGNTHFKDGVVTEKMPLDAKPIFVFTDDFIEFQGNRLSISEFERLAESEIKDKPFLKKVFKYISYSIPGIILAIVK